MSGVVSPPLASNRTHVILVMNPRACPGESYLLVQITDLTDIGMHLYIYFFFCLYMGVMECSCSQTLSRGFDVLTVFNCFLLSEILSNRNFGACSRK